MTIDLNSLVAVITVIAFICGAVNYIVILPLKNSIKGLEESIQNLSAIFHELNEKQNCVDKRVVLLEVKVETNERRLDKLEAEK